MQGDWDGEAEVDILRLPDAADEGEFGQQDAEADVEVDGGSFISGTSERGEDNETDNKAEYADGAADEG